MRLSLCLNCLQAGAKGVAVGPEKGSQRDPYQEHVMLCETCEEALLTGDFDTLASRHTNERMVSRADAVDHP